MKKNLVAILLIFIIAIPTGLFLLNKGYFNMHDDMHPIRIVELERCFADGQVPCRWSPLLGYGYGMAMYNFYSAFPYYLGAAIRAVFPVSILTTIKILMFLSIFVSGVGMYLLGKKFWGRLGGLLAATLYIYAPYHALDIYIRGALAEAFALTLIPFIWLSFANIIERQKFKDVALGALALGLFLTTHNISTLLFAPPTIIWVIFLLYYYRSYRAIKDIAVTGLLAVGLAAFFIIPNLAEQNLIQKETLIQDYLFYGGHFVNLEQLFLDRDWGAGSSIFGPNDDLSFQIGWPHWWLTIPVFAGTLLMLIKKRNKNKALIAILLLSLVAVNIFMAHTRSGPIWSLVPILAYVQFPWRFLGPAIFYLSFAGGALAIINFPARKKILIAAILLTIFLNKDYFRGFELNDDVTDERKLTGTALELQQKAAISDYLPKTSPNIPSSVAPDDPQIVSGNGSITNYVERSNSFEFLADLSEESQIAVPMIYYPHWEAQVNGYKLEVRPSGNFGEITVTVPQGQHEVKAQFVDTPIRRASNLVTLIATGVLLYGLLRTNRGHKFIGYRI